ncbi:MAG: hypothetical protein J6T26_04150 [Firmicutes bacterium]|nr:hypothetical protein [Bacillota bacterium]
MMINTDAHCTEQLLYGVDQTIGLLRDIGFRQIMVWRDGKFVKRKL